MKKYFVFGQVNDIFVRSADAEEKINELEEIIAGMKWDVQNIIDYQLEGDFKAVMTDLKDKWNKITWNFKE